MVLPVVNLIGVYQASRWNRRRNQNEMKTAAIFYGITAAAIALLMLGLRTGMWGAVLALCLSTTAIVGINTVLVGLAPLHYSNLGRVSTVTGLLNSSVHLGSAMASDMSGRLAQGWGWSAAILFWFLSALLGALLCVAGSRRWGNFTVDSGC